MPSSNPRLTAMRAELAELEARRAAGLTPRDSQRARILEAALRAYGSDAELERAEAEARAAR